MNEGDKTTSKMIAYDDDCYDDYDEDYDEDDED
jgi:hypothetical protein